MALAIPDIIDLYRSTGAARYGMEAVNQEQHALQCAVLAERAGSPPELVAAALLHDLGHLLSSGREGEAARDGLHEYVPIPFLRGTFPDAVIEPIRLHVEAKRYLCAVSSGYRDGLSPASQRSLALQGGPFTADEARVFIRQRHAGEAVALRRWDDQAKDPAAITPGWSHFQGVLVKGSASRAVPV